jgi:hypothetical protein
MEVTVMGSSGNAPGNLVALDNFVIKMVSNGSAEAGDATNGTVEPAAEVRKKVIKSTIKQTDVNNYV